MATSRSLREFAERMNRGLPAEFLAGADRVLRKAALQAHQTATVATPVDTGRARANWTANVGSVLPADNEPSMSGEPKSDSRGAANAQISLDQARGAIGGVALTFGRSGGRDSAGRFLSGNPTIFVANTLPYIEQLDRGRSDQAPNGMTRQALDAALALIRRERFLEG
jgi:hypothetical protein